jgi:uncharacterized protein YbbC (DUF1343 family)
LHIEITNRERFDPIALAVALLCSAWRLYPDRFTMTKYLDSLWGSENLRAMVEEGRDYREILETCRPEIERFRQIRKRYLLYR